MGTKKKTATEAEPPVEDLNDLTIDELRDKAEAEGVDLTGANTKAEIIERFPQAGQQPAGGSGPVILDTPISKPPKVAAQIEFAEPDLEKPIINALNGKPVEVVMLTGKAIPEGKPGEEGPQGTVLIFVQDGTSTDFITKDRAVAAHRFAQDVDGQIYYWPHGWMGSQLEYKPLDLALLEG